MGKLKVTTLIHSIHSLSLRQYNSCFIRLKFVVKKNTYSQQKINGTP